jgi:magnesium and cobalt transporter
MMDLGRLPKGGETIDLDRFRFRVLRADNRRIHLLEMTLHDGQEPTPAVADE